MLFERDCSDRVLVRKLVKDLAQRSLIVGLVTTQIVEQQFHRRMGDLHALRGECYDQRLISRRLALEFCEHLSRDAPDQWLVRLVRDQQMQCPSCKAHLPSIEVQMVCDLAVHDARRLPHDTARCRFAIRRLGLRGTCRFALFAHRLNRSFNDVADDDRRWGGAGLSRPLQAECTLRRTPPARADRLRFELLERPRGTGRGHALSLAIDEARADEALHPIVRLDLEAS